MNMEQQLAYLQKVLEMGAKIEIKFHNIREEKEAVKTATELSKLVQIPPMGCSHQGTSWIGIGEISNQIRTTVFYDKYMVEDVNLDGVADAI